MESYALQNFPPAHSTIHIALFHNVTNAPQIRQWLIKASQLPPGEEGDKARADVDFGFIEGDLLVSKEHLLSAILATLLYAYPSTSPAPTDPPSLSSPGISSLSLNDEPDRVPKTRSHNLHSEILMLLSPNNNISDSIRRHGLSDKTTRLAVVKFGQRGRSGEEVWKEMEKVVDGELVGLDRVGEGVDWAKVDKVYKLSELNALKVPDVMEKKKAAVVSTVAVKNAI